MTARGFSATTILDCEAVTVRDVWGKCSTLVMPGCHPAIFARGRVFWETASADDRATAVVEATLGLGLAPTDREAWRELWEELHGSSRRCCQAGEERAFRLGLDFGFHPRNLVYCAYWLKGSEYSDPPQIWEGKPVHYP